MERLPGVEAMLQHLRDMRVIMGLAAAIRRIKRQIFSMPDTSLLLMFDEVRGATLRMLAGVNETSARWHPRGLSNSVLWHAGHCYVVVEWLTMQALGQEPQAPDGWFELFGWDSRPGETPIEKYPPLGTLIPLLESQHVRLRSMLASLSDEQLSQPSAQRADRTVRHAILHAFQDEASHKGEMWLLRKLQARPN